MNKAWRNISPRERGLLVGVLLVLALASGYLVVARAGSHLVELDAAIGLLEEDLFYYTAEAARTYEVELAASRMADQHSSVFTQEEIHDGLRKEIYRLSLSNPAGGKLVNIPSLPYGRLSQSGEGFREYQIEFRTAPAPIGNLVIFLQRLQESPQALFINSLTLERAAQEQYMTPSFVVTRTILDDVPIDLAHSDREAPLSPAPDPTILNPSFEQWDAAQSAFPGWLAEGCALRQSSEHVTHGAACLKAAPANGRGILYQRLELVAGAKYELAIDATATGAVSLGIWNAESDQPVVDSIPLKSDGGTWRQPIPFEVPGSPGSTVPLLAPYIILEDGNAVVYVDNVVLTSVGD